MNSKELRQGNLVLIDNGDFANIRNNEIAEIIEIKRTVCMVRYFLDGKERHSQVTHDRIFPIILNENWLRNFRFKNMKDPDCPLYAKYYNKRRNALIITEDARGNWFIIAKDKVIIKYAHKLQNVFCDLFDEELIYKLKP